MAFIDLASRSLHCPLVWLKSALLNPVSRVLALRVSMDTLQMYDLDRREVMKMTVMHYPVHFWKWLDAKTLAIVTGTAVYYWTTDADSKPTHICNRTMFEGSVQITDYRASADRKWLLLGGMAAMRWVSDRAVGVLQVYSVDLRTSQPMQDVYAATFASVILDDREAPPTLLCYTTKGAAGPRLRIHEWGVPKEWLSPASPSCSTMRTIGTTGRCRWSPTTRAAVCSSSRGPACCCCTTSSRASASLRRRPAPTPSSRRSTARVDRVGCSLLMTGVECLTTLSTRSTSCRTSATHCMTGSSACRWPSDTTCQGQTTCFTSCFFRPPGLRLPPLPLTAALL